MKHTKRVDDQASTSIINVEGVRPTITPDDVDVDKPVRTVADPCLVYVNEQWYVFYEVLTKDRQLKTIGVSSSKDGVHFSWLGVVLDEADSRLALSYPYVFRDGDTWYMVPEQLAQDTNSHRNFLYTTSADSFPFGWTRAGVFFDVGDNEEMTDKSVVQHNGMWYVFYSVGNSRRQELRLVSFADMDSRHAVRHPHSPLVRSPASSVHTKFICSLTKLAATLKRKWWDIDTNDILSTGLTSLVNTLRFYPSRPGGAIIQNNEGGLIVFLQYYGDRLLSWDLRQSYGAQVAAMVVRSLTPETIDFVFETRAVLVPTGGSGWNSEKMHTFSPLCVDGRTLVAVDGYGVDDTGERRWNIAIFELDKNRMPWDLLN